MKKKSVSHVFIIRIFYPTPKKKKKKAVHKSTENSILLACHLQYWNNFTFPLSVDNVIKKNKAWIYLKGSFLV